MSLLTNTGLIADNIYYFNHGNKHLVMILLKCLPRISVSLKNGITAEYGVNFKTFVKFHAPKFLHYITNQ